MSRATLTLAQTAERVGLSAERFRKIWRDQVAHLGFPAPLRHPAPRFLGGPAIYGSYAWDAAAVEAWAAGRSRAGLPPEPEPKDLKPPRPSPGDPALARERRELQSLMHGMI